MRGWRTIIGLGLTLPMASVSSAAPDSRPQQVWRARPAPAEAKAVPHHVRIVDYGDDFAWNYNVHQYRGGKSQGVVPDLDLDGDGQADDCIGFWEFSLDNPLNPVSPHWDTEAASSIFYGGFTGFFTNKQRNCFTEMCTNVDHPGDNINMMVTGNNDPYRCYGIWLWKKEDFINGGNANRVGFDDRSKLGLHIARYWTGLDEGRYVVQDGDRFYISEFTFAGDSYPGQGRGRGVTHVLHPTRTRWAEYNPRPPHDIVFDGKQAAFTEHDFRDVRTVGYYAAKTELTAGSTWLKQYAFEVYATVHKPARASELLDMAKVPGGEVTLPGGETVHVGEFYMSTCEVPYAAWQKVWRWAVSPMSAFDWGYVFDRDGDMGSMDSGSFEHGPDEPATDMTWLDAAAWCNALSELEGWEAAYYADPEFSIPFRKVRERYYDAETNVRYVPKVHVKWDADGYRLPTPAEWVHANNGAAPDVATAWLRDNSGGKTHDAGSNKAGPLGLYDMMGNVWEWVWDAGGDFDAGVDNMHTVLGGGLHFPEDPLGAAASPYGDEPFAGAHNIGFRVVRSVAGAARGPVSGIRSPAGFDAEGTAFGVPAWTFRKGEKTVHREPTPAAEPPLDLVTVPEGALSCLTGAEIFISAFQMGRYETTYEFWKQVRDWAEANGYRFNYDGDMGSMYHETTGHRHSAKEPVTRITGFDMFAWCNALSEMEGRTPCYYTDEARTALYRQSLPYREATTFRGPWGAGIRGKGSDRVVVNWAADGYRLPTRAEWEYACRAGAKTAYYWGDRFDAEHAWCAENADGTTHPVGDKSPNALGLHDMAGNVFERCWGGGRGNYNPFDLRNPKGGMAYNNSYVRGGSFRYPSTPPYHRYFQPAYDRPGCRMCFAYPEIGFRVVRCEKDTHVVDGVEKVEVVLNDVDLTAPVDPLEGATFRGNLQRTGSYNDKGVPALTGEKWRFKTDGPVRSSPVVVDGLAYVGSDDGFFYAIEVATGKEAWQFKTRGAVQSSATVKGGSVYFGANDGRLYALDAKSGELCWKLTVPGCRSVGGSPVVAYGSVFAFMGGAGYKTGLVAANAETGEQICRYPVSDFPGGLHAFTLAPGELISSSAGNANGMGSRGSAISIRTGRPRTLRTDRACGTAALVDGLVYSAGMCVSAVDLQSGNGKWLTWLEGKGWKDSATYQNTTHAAALVHGDAVYVGNETAHFYAFDRRNGKRRWTADVGGPVRSSAAGAGDVVYFGCDDGHIYALDAATGEQRWKFKTGAVVRSSPCIADGALYVGSDDGHVYALH